MQTVLGFRPHAPVFNLEAKMAILLCRVQQGLLLLVSGNEGAQNKRSWRESLHDEREDTHPRRGSVASWDGASH